MHGMFFLWSGSARSELP